MCCGSLQGRCPRPFGCSLVVNCVAMSRPHWVVRFLLSVPNVVKNISLHLFVPVLSYLSRDRENVSGECGRSGCNRLLVISRPVKFETIQVKLETIQACAKMQAHENPFDTKKWIRQAWESSHSSLRSGLCVLSLTPLNLYGKEIPCIFPLVMKCFPFFRHDHHKNSEWYPT